MITREQVAELREGDVVELRNATWPDETLVRGQLYEASDWLYVAEQPIRNEDGRPVLGGSYTLTVVSHAPRPLYVNHPRTKPVSGDVASNDIVVFHYLGCSREHWYGQNGKEASPGDSLTLLVDGETGQVVP